MQRTLIFKTWAARILAVAALLLVALTLLSVSTGWAASTVTMTATPPWEGTRGEKSGCWVVYLDITAHTDGTVSDYALPTWLTTILSRGYYLFLARTVPDGVTPMTALYDITVVDPYSLDLFGGNLTNRSASAAEEAKPNVGVAQPVICPANNCASALTVTVSNNSVNAGKTTLILFFAKYD